jgi:hypothetical protein
MRSASEALRRFIPQNKDDGAADVLSRCGIHVLRAGVRAEQVGTGQDP